MNKIPAEVLSQHIAVLGKTGAGKTSTEKLIVEQVAEADFRVCVLDTVKSDWWGITSSADGKRPGLPFKILGGPHGHVPLHSSAGKVIGQLVGAGKLPLSIIDMADFEAGGIQRFFVDFAPALMRSAKGVLYLVIEEAHELAPKERAGFGAESMAIHWAKKLATAGRSKGIRLIVATQRVQSLHNAVLGSCETVIAHRLTTPADQEPVLKWLKANTDRETQEKVAASLSSLPTGTGWICSGEAKLFEQRAFPKFKTYDNTATPTGDSAEVIVKTAPVDQDELRAIIGDAVKEAEENDPKALRKQLAEANRKLVAAQQASKPEAKQEVQRASATKDKEAIRALKADLLRYRRALEAAVKIIVKVKAFEFDITTPDGNAVLERAIAAAVEQVTAPIEKRVSALVSRIDGVKQQAAAAETAINALLSEKVELSVEVQKAEPYAVRAAPAPVQRRAPVAPAVASGSEVKGGAFRSMMVALAQAGRPLQDNQVAARAGMALSGTFDKYLGQMRTNGWVEGSRSDLRITHAGLEALGPYDPLPTGVELQNYWLNYVGNGAKRSMLDVLIQAYPDALPDSVVAERASMALSGTFDKYLGQLRTLQLVSGSRQALQASEELFG